LSTFNAYRAYIIFTEHVLNLDIEHIYKLKNARFLIKAKKIVGVRSIWVGLGRYSTSTDPIVSRMPLGCLPDSKLREEQMRIPGSPGKANMFNYFSYSPFGK